MFLDTALTAAPVAIACVSLIACLALALPGNKRNIRFFGEPASSMGSALEPGSFQRYTNGAFRAQVDGVKLKCI
jgi:hypothetical protein